MTAADLFYMALNTRGDSPQCAAAMAVCEIRGIPPYNTVYTQIGALQQWQAIVYEALLMGFLSHG